MLFIKFKSQRGVAIVLAVLILSIILAIGLGLSSILLRQVRMMREIGYSVIAFFAADNGIEEVLLLPTPNNIPETSLPNGAKYQVFVKTPGGDCNAQNYCIKSIGTYGTTKRAIEIKY